jgi:hypothetical protein
MIIMSGPTGMRLARTISVFSRTTVTICRLRHSRLAAGPDQSKIVEPLGVLEPAERCNHGGWRGLMRGSRSGDRAC